MELHGLHEVRSASEPDALSPLCERVQVPTSIVKASPFATILVALVAAASACGTSDTAPDVPNTARPELTTTAPEQDETSTGDAGDETSTRDADDETSTGEAEPREAAEPTDTQRWVSMCVDGEGTSAVVMASEDGVRWQRVTGLPDVLVLDLATDGAGTWVVAGSHEVPGFEAIDGGVMFLASSTDLHTWEPIDIGDHAGHLRHVVHTDSGWFAVGDSQMLWESMDARVFVSADGERWEPILSGLPMREVYGAGVGEDGEWWIIGNGANERSGDDYGLLVSEDGGARWEQSTIATEYGLVPYTGRGYPPEEPATMLRPRPRWVSLGEQVIFNDVDIPVEHEGPLVAPVSGFQDSSSQWIGVTRVYDVEIWVLLRKDGSGEWSTIDLDAGDIEVPQLSLSGERWFIHDWALGSPLLLSSEDGLEWVPSGLPCEFERAATLGPVHGVVS